MTPFQSSELMKQRWLSSDKSLEEQLGKLCLFVLVKHSDGCLTMTFQLQAQITLSLLTKAQKTDVFHVFFFWVCNRGE